MLELTCPLDSITIRKQFQVEYMQLLAELNFSSCYETIEIHNFSSLLVTLLLHSTTYLSESAQMLSTEYPIASLRESISTKNSKEWPDLVAHTTYFLYS